MDQEEEYIKRIIKALVYIEEHLDEPFTMEELAKVAAYSPFHFHRLFHAIVGETVHHYVKRLRMEQAAGRLRYSDAPITHIALEAGYDTPSAFTRAFKQWRGASPAGYRALHALVEITKQQLKELPMVHPDTIETVPDMDLLFIRKYGNYNSSPWKAWQAMSEFMHQHHLDDTKLRRISISYDDPKITSEEKLRFDACIPAPSGIKESGEVGRRVMKGGKCAIFTHHGPYETLDQFFTSICTKWLPTSGENFDDTRPPFCEHFHMELLRSDPSKLVTKVHIPLK